MGYAKKTASLVATVSLMLVMSACSGGIHLHRDADQKLAQSAQDRFREARLTESLTEEKRQVNAFQAREKELAQHHFQIQRDAEVATFISQPPHVFLQKIEERVKEVAGDISIARQVTLQGEKVRLRSDTLRSSASVYRLNRPSSSDPNLACPVPKRPFTFSSELIKGAFENYRKACDDLLAAKAPIPLVKDKVTLLETVTKAIEDLEKEQKELSDKVGTAKGNYETAKAEYAKAVKQKDSREVSEKAKELKDKLESLAKPLDLANKDVERLGVGGLGLLGLQEALKEQLDSVNQVLDAAIAGKPAGAKASQDKDKILLGVVGTVSSLADKIGQDWQYPKITELLLESERLRLDLLLVDRSLERANVNRDLLHKQRDALVTEVEYLVTAHTALTGGPKAQGGVMNACPPDRAVGENFQIATAETASCRRQAVAALSAYGLSWAAGRVPAEEAWLETLSNRHLAALEKSEIALAQWENLIGVPLSTLVAYHSGGVTAQEIAELIGALSLIAIAKGVN